MPTHAKPGNSGHEDAYPEAKTYSGLLDYVAKAREVEVIAAGTAVKSVASTVRNTVGALKHFMAAAGASETSIVSADFVDERRFHWILKQIELLPLSDTQRRRVLSEVTGRIQFWANMWLNTSKLDVDLQFLSEDSFAIRLQLALKSNPEKNLFSLARIVGLDQSKIYKLANGSVAALTNISKEVRDLEILLNLRPGFLVEKLTPSCRSWPVKADVHRSKQRRISAHLPKDFQNLPQDKKVEILSWIEENILFANFVSFSEKDDLKSKYSLKLDKMPPSLRKEIDDFISYKISDFTPIGLSRNTTWSNKVYTSYVQHVLMFFGAMLKIGYDERELSLALICHPHIIDEYIEWRYQRRGGYTVTTSMFLEMASSVLRPETGYITQLEAVFRQKYEQLSRKCGNYIENESWLDVCKNASIHIDKRLLELKKKSEIGRSVYEPILPVLDSPKPVLTYMRIVSEIKKRARNRSVHPVRWAEDMRAIMMVRLGLDTGFRQKNLRQLLFCPLGSEPQKKSDLSKLEIGQIYFDGEAWKVFMPISAFKNKNSSAFSGRDVTITLRDRGGLYSDISNYIEARNILLDGCEASVFLVKSISGTRAKDPCFDQAGYYNTFRAIVASYGVYNPYTGTGAIEGLKPHGPHALRDVLATHVIKQTSSYERAAAIIMDSVETVKSHYARWMPGEQFDLAQRTLDSIYREMEAGE